jgi:hypothetical protein
MLGRPSLPAAATASEQGGLGWLLVLPIGMLLLLQTLIAAGNGIAPGADVLADPDSYMHLNRVLELYRHGDWFDSREHRIFPPEGHVQHWTRALDLLLLTGGWLLRPYFGFAGGLYLWGVIFSPLCLALTVVALDWAVRPILPREARLIACLALILQPIVAAYSALGRADHHALLLLLATLLLGFCIRLLTRQHAFREATFAGLAAAFGLWVSTEFLVFIGVAMAALGMGWLAATGGMGMKNQRFASALTVGTGLALLVERGPVNLGALENDRLSVIHVAIFAFIALFWWLARHLTSDDRPWRTRSTQIQRHYADGFAFPHPKSKVWLDLPLRGLLALGGVVTITLLLFELFPQLGAGPLGRVEPLYDHLRLQRIAEIQPLIPAAWFADQAYGELAHRFIMMLGIALLALPFLIWALAARAEAPPAGWLPIAVALMAFLPLALHQLRWFGYLQLLLVMPYAGAVYHLLRKLPPGTSDRGWRLLRPLVIVGALFWPLTLAQLLPRPVTDVTSGICPITTIAPALQAMAAGEPKTILTLADHGPEILYRTRHRVLSIPNHRPQPGFAVTFRSLTAGDDKAALEELRRHRVDWILLCPGEIEGAFFRVDSDPSRTVYQRLIEGDAPAWAIRVPLRLEADASARWAYLYAVEPPPGGFGDEAVADLPGRADPQNRKAR